MWEDRNSYASVSIVEGLVVWYGHMETMHGMITRTTPSLIDGDKWKRTPIYMCVR